MQKTDRFDIGSTTYYFSNNNSLPLALPPHHVFITDANVFNAHPYLFKDTATIVIDPGEEYKVQSTIDFIIDKLLHHQVHRKTTLIGVGGGIVTDITGYVASVYMRGIPFGFIPTSLLGMADAAIGGKNGINHGLHKNMIGTISQPGFIVYNTTLLKSLPDCEWRNGFAEIIKYTCLFDEPLFLELGDKDISFYQENELALTDLIKTCVKWKTQIVLADEREQNQRKLLNFGHTAGHAIETIYHIPHGQAVAIGMVIACTLSEQVLKTDPTTRQSLLTMLSRYELPSTMNIDVKQVMEVLTMDKKRNDNGIEYILLKKIGAPYITLLSFDNIEKALLNLNNGSHN